MIVVDSSVLIAFLRGRQTIATGKLKEMEDGSIPFAIPAVCAQEVLQGARDEKEWRLLLEYLSSQHLLLPQDPWSTHAGAARIYFDCRRKGYTIRSTIDCFIAQLVVEHEGTLLHDDDDFDKIAGVCPLKTMPR